MKIEGVRYRADSHYVRPIDQAPIKGWSVVRVPELPEALVAEPLASQVRHLAATGRVDEAQTLIMWFR